MVVLFYKSVKLLWGDEGVDFEIVVNLLIRKIEPKLIEVEDGSLLFGEPDGVAFGFAEFAIGYFVDDERSRPDFSFGVLQAFDKVEARGAVAKLISATELEVDTVGAVEMEEVVALNQGVRELRIGNAGATFADTGADEFAIEQLGHAELFADFTEKMEIAHVFEPVIVVDEGEIRFDDLLKLGGDFLFIVLYFTQTLQVAFAGVFGVADLTCGAADEEEWGIAVHDEAMTHHQGSEVADGHRVGGWVDAEVEFAGALV